MSYAMTGFFSAPVALLITSHRHMLEFNDAFMALFGFGREEMSGQSVRMLYPSGSDYDAIGARCEKWLRRHRDYEDKRFMQRRSGEIFLAQTHGRTETPADPYALMVWVFAEIRGEPAIPEVLTPREHEIATQIVNGKTCKEIAKLFGISHRTVEAHRAAVMQKLGARNTADLVSRITLRE